MKKKKASQKLVHWKKKKKINETDKLLTGQDKSRENTKLPTSGRKEGPSLLTTKTLKGY